MANSVFLYLQRQNDIITGLNVVRSTNGEVKWLVSVNETECLLGLCLDFNAIQGSNSSNLAANSNVSIAECTVHHPYPTTDSVCLFGMWSGINRYTSEP